MMLAKMWIGAICGLALAGVIDYYLPEPVPYGISLLLACGLIGIGILLGGI